MPSLLHRITVHPDKCSGQPCIRGTRIRVTDILALLAGGESPEQILADFPQLEREDILASLGYATRCLSQHDVIASATVAGDKLIVISCAPTTYEVAFDDVPALAVIPRQEREQFELDEDGSFLHWPSTDTHIDLDAICNAIDPEYRERARVAKATHNREYGNAIAALRQQSGLRQSDVDGLPEAQVRRIEAGAPTSVDSLRLLAKAHNLRLSAYLDRLADQLEQRSGVVTAAHRDDSSPHVVLPPRSECL